MESITQQNIAEHLRTAIPSDPNGVTEISHIPDADVRGVIDAAWQLLDQPIAIHPSLSPSIQAGLLRRLCLKIAAEHDILPTAFYVVGVVVLDKEPFDTGSCADIYQGRYEESLVILKRPRVGADEKAMRKVLMAFCRESLLWSRLQHDHVLPFLGISTTAFQRSICIILPYMENGDIRRRLQSKEPRLQLTEANHEAHFVRWLYQTALGLDYLHSQGVVHGDLHCGNLIDQYDHVRLTDFGFSLIAEATPGRYGSAHGGAAYHFMAPEFFGDDGVRPTRETDVYAYGCTCIELYKGSMPWDGAAMGVLQIGRHVLKGRRPARPFTPLGSQMSKPMWDVVEASWAPKPSDRLTADAIVRAMETFVPNV